jgi:hypothetical protein
MVPFYSAKQANPTASQTLLQPNPNRHYPMKNVVTLQPSTLFQIHQARIPQGFLFL